MMLSEAERFQRLCLIRSENVGPATYHGLMQRFGSAGEALRALPELSARGGMKRKIRICPPEEAEAEIRAAHKAGARYVMSGEPDYPPLLQHIHAPPPVLCLKGDRKVLHRPGLAIVGSRNASALGRKLTGEIAAEMAAAGYCIISGLARGIDTAAHEASVDQASVAVLAGGVDVIYPPENHALYERISRQGAVLSEMPPGFTPRGRDFPRRNRLVSGMALGTLVVEAAARSGSLITARLAREQNREVFAVPGSPKDPRAAGTNRLLRDGAVLTCGAADILEVLGPMSGDMIRPPGLPLEEAEAPCPAAPDEIDSDGRRRLIALLGPVPVSIDELIRQAEMPPAQVHEVLMELDLAGRLDRNTPGAVGLA
ncbi:MAG: DNA-protecting protein DprA [Hyphomicrobiales bacterium]|mgnify:CR=1 FL=1|nr:MAG: DNA-protecting protein DprA [Hyphomicrobiales bacterium]